MLIDSRIPEYSSSHLPSCLHAHHTTLPWWYLSRLQALAHERPQLTPRPALREDPSQFPAQLVLDLVEVLILGELFRSQAH